MTNPQNIAELLDKLNPQAKYAFIRANSETLPLEVVRDAIRHFHSFPAHSEEQETAVWLATRKGLLEDVVDIHVSNRQFAEAAKYPEIVASRDDKNAIFGELEGRLNSKDFVNEHFRNTGPSTEYALWLSEFGEQIGIPREKTNEFVLKAVNFAYQASHVGPGRCDGEFSFSSIPALVQKLESMGNQKEAWRLSRITLDQALIKDFGAHRNGLSSEGITILYRPDFYLQIAEKVYGTAEKAREEFYLTLQKMFADLDVDVPGKQEYEQKDSGFHHRKQIIGLLEKYSFPGVDNYKRIEVRWQINSLRKHFAPYSYEEDTADYLRQYECIEEALAHAEQLGDESLKSQIYSAAMEGLLYVSQHGGGYVGTCPIYCREAQKLIRDALPLRSVALLDRMIKAAFEIYSVGRDLQVRSEVTRLVEEAGLFEQLKPALGHNFPDFGRTYFGNDQTDQPLDLYHLILKIKCREYLRQVYEREVNKLESEGYFKACLRRSRFVGDEKRIALYQPIEEWLEQNRGEAKEK